MHFLKFYSQESKPSAASSVQEMDSQTKVLVQHVTVLIDMCSITQM